MSLTDLHQYFHTHGYEAIRTTAVTSTDEYFYLAVLAFGSQDIAHAHLLLEQAAHAEPESLLYREAERYLARVLAHGKQHVYVEPEAFSAFIRGGGNLPLYHTLSAALRARYMERQTTRLLDIGVGDGLALLPAIVPTLTEINLVEPSAALLTQTSRALHERGFAYQAFQGTIQEFMQQPTRTWNLTQATFSLQSLPPAERATVFAWIHKHTEQILIAEFDVPELSAMYAPDRVTYVATHFEQGLAEYRDDNGLVAQGFLLPVMFGYFDQTAARTNYEQPIAEWVQQLRDAGFTSIHTEPLYTYWWATAYLIDAR